MANRKTVMFPVEIAYALPGVQILKKITVTHGCTLHDAILISKIIDQFPEIDLAKQRVGIFGKFAQLNTPLQSHDRIEIYRPLIIDPKDARRQRAKIKLRRCQI